MTKCPKCDHNLWNYKIRFDGTVTNICDKCKYDDYAENKTQAESKDSVD